MQSWVVICWTLLALVAADECPDGGRCDKRQTCCNNPADGYDCCPFEQAECCGDHMHCCPTGTICDTAKASCVNSTVSIPWVERASTDQPRHSKSFRMIKAYMGEENDNICPDQSQCPPEFSCLRALTRFGCCPLAQGVPCSDGKHCCPEGHQCSTDSRSCFKKELVTTVLCSDGVSECPDETTCSETPEGKWGCCPMPKAVCCEDKLHCCPEGSMCDVEHTKCISLSTRKELPMWAKLPARLRADWENQKNEQVTAQAIDNGGSGKTYKATTVNKLPFSEKEVSELSVTKAAGGNDVPCNETVGCPDGTTCCKTKDGQWACCPLPEAVCCEDFIHCCPKGKTCNLTAQTCEDGTSSVPWLEKVPTIPRLGVRAGDVQCDSTASCPDGTTCCKTKDGQWACCPLPEAVCCEDFIHCCPKGKKCNLTAQTCEDGTSSVPWLEKVPTIPRLGVRAGDVQCDSTASCPDGTTCCKTKDGQWACCPLPEAVCCEDFIHCCPKGKKCNLTAQTCEDSTSSVPWLEKVPTIPRQGVRAGDVQCDSTASCPDGTTCCKTKDGQWACCPLPEAVCCEDFIHCCPKGKKCNLTAQTCEDSTSSVPWLEKVPTIPRLGVRAGDVQCDSTASCPDGTTCCKTKDGQWACCPLPEAVCCEDFIHCCPKGKKCNLTAQTCEDGTSSVPWLEKVPTIPRQGVRAGDVQCDSTASCPDGTTCCKTKDGQWACCPLPEAVCCEDFIHCCPKGKKCNLTAQTCEDGTSSVPWLEKVPTIPRQGVRAGDVQCDSTASCPDGTTCCKTKDGQWACCPLPEAVCCEDFIHCCPKGKKCNLTAQTCEDGTSSVPWLEKVPTIPRQGVRAGDVQCDSTASCPDGTTCCKTKDGQWACCPLPEAVCCEDFIHCCPKGKKCNLTAQTCEDGTSSEPWLEKVPTIPRQGVRAGDVQCDSTASCPDGTTCCKTKDGQWACCPLPEAVCCEDFIHCCPKGKKCNLTAQTCEDGTSSEPWLEKVPTIPRLGVRAGDVQCDSTASCPDGTTCCKTKDGQWACCPLPEAVCCDDHEHCCPSGTICDLSSLKCMNSSGTTPMKLKVPAFATAAPTTVATTTEGQVTSIMQTVEGEPDEKENKEVEGRIQCDDHTSCPQHTTCCYMSSAQKWGCCPLPHAVCCADGNHCCPTSYKCDELRTSCVKEEVVIPWYTKLPATTSVQPQPSSVQCDGLNQCPEHTSCCRLFTGEWGCCPLQNAVCCPDKEHCCPQGYTCNVASQSCQKLIILPLETVPLTPVYLPEHQRQPSPLKDIPCDEHTSCEDGTTCCRMSATTWGCCPLPNAVCCSDMKYCCPSGYSCTEGGTCIKDTRLHWYNWQMFSNKKEALLL
uniref:Granulin a n=1 Tax=Mastacembelus armatus TaxID=205130 RepID=A0A3Q3N845_9TELE